MPCWAATGSRAGWLADWLTMASLPRLGGHNPRADRRNRIPSSGNATVYCRPTKRIRRSRTSVAPAPGSSASTASMHRRPASRPPAWAPRAVRQPPRPCLCLCAGGRRPARHIGTPAAGHGRGPVHSCCVLATPCDVHAAGTTSCLLSVSLEVGRARGTGAGRVQGFCTCEESSQHSAPYFCVPITNGARLRGSDGSLPRRLFPFSGEGASGLDVPSLG